MCRLLGWLALLLFLFFSAPLLHGQTEYGTILGTVSDSSGEGG
jgi:hypothetical protein